MNSDLLLWTKKKKTIGHWNVNAGFLFLSFFLFLIIIIYWYSDQVSSQEPLGGKQRDVHNPS